MKYLNKQKKAHLNCKHLKNHMYGWYYLNNVLEFTKKAHLTFIIQICPLQSEQYHLTPKLIVDKENKLIFDSNTIKSILKNLLISVGFIHKEVRLDQRQFLLGSINVGVLWCFEQTDKDFSIQTQRQRIPGLLQK